MIAGHYATALVADQKLGPGHIGYLLVASQLPDLVWLALAAVGLPPMHFHGGPIDPSMMLTHDLVPLLGWIGLAVGAGRVLFKRWGPGWVGGLLVFVHELSDLLVGFPHNLWGPDSAAFGLNLYGAAPQLAVGLEAAFAVILVGGVLWRDRRAGLRRARRTYVAWALVFGGGISGNFLSADQLGAMDPNAALPTAELWLTIGLYAFQIAVLWWGHSAGRPAVGSTAAPGAPAAA